MNFVKDYIAANPLREDLVHLLIILLASFLAFVVVKWILQRLVATISSRLGWVAQEYFKDQILLRRVVYLVPLLILFQANELGLFSSERLPEFLRRITIVLIILTTLSISSRFLSKSNEIYSRRPISRSRPIKGYLQIANILLYGIGVIFVMATLLNKSPVVFLSGLGAMTAIVLLVFRDTLLSLVAGMQLTTNDLIRVGDWIEMPQFGADGDVVDIALHVVKVQNWDKTITMIPTHKFLENSFKNWRGMSESGGRRIKRALYIDLTSVRFLRKDELEFYSKFAYLKDYLNEKQNEIAEYNQKLGGDPENGHDILYSGARWLTNIGTFRAYLVNYLKHHPMIHKEMTFIVRQLQATADGLPLEIYVFSRDTRWAVYEALQADIFDHVLAVINKFDLRVYQKPSGFDLRQINQEPAPESHN